jgi:2-(1,2-epoxy-1,2-dihydrophenyl)acetyl-CoA isomerase
MSAEYRFLRFDVRDGVARLQFHRPESLNSINREMTTELRAVAGRCADDPSIRVLLMSGAGSAFSTVWQPAAG